MVISRKKRSLQPEFPLHLNGDPLESVTSFKYLGVYISSDLSWSEHIKQVCVKAKRMIGLLYRNFNSLCYSDLCVFSVYTGRSYHSHPLSIKPLFCRTNSFSHSFVPFTIHLWNSLDSSLCSESSFVSFKHNLTYFYTHRDHVLY